MYRCRLFAFAAIAICTLARPAAGHPTESVFRLDLPQGELHGTKLIPHIHRPVPCIVIVGGDLSQDRDGGLHADPLSGERFSAGKSPARDALRRLAEALQAGGYGSLRYDRIGFGRSRPGPEWRGTHGDEAAIVAAVIQHARGSRDFGKVIVLSEGTGAISACLTAQAGLQADGYILLGAPCDSPAGLLAYEFGQLVAYADSSPERLAWANSQARYPLALGRHFPQVLKAAAEGRTDYQADDRGFAFEMRGLPRLREELRLPAAELFQHLKSPVFLLAASGDRSVPPEHAPQIAALLNEAGNRDATSRVITGVDRNFQRLAAGTDQQIREHYEKSSLRRPYEAKAYHAILEWLYERFPTPAEGYPERVEQVASQSVPEPRDEK